MKNDFRRSLLNIITTSCLAITLSFNSLAQEITSRNQLASYNVHWQTPGNSSKNSMPLGNGDIGLNVWTEQDGKICFFIGKTDAWDENGRLLKIGKIEVKISPNPFTNNDFTQSLLLNDGSIEIKTAKTKFVIWVDAMNPIVHINAQTPDKHTITATTKIWRNKVETMTKLEVSDLNFFPEIYGPTVMQPDVLMTEKNKVAWYHLNPEASGFYKNLEMQGMDKYRLTNPLKDRIFGAAMEGDNFTKQNDSTLISLKGTKRNLSIAVLTEHPSTPTKWISSINQILNNNRGKNIDNNYRQHKQWWKDFWNRSRIEISNNDTVTTNIGKEYVGRVLSRGYALQRFVTACAGRGEYPIKFNGSLFTVDYAGNEGYGDYRRWGTGYWWQNTRLPVLSLFATGDFEMTRPLFNMYFNQLPFATHRTKVSFQHDGAYFAECTYFWGASFSESWGKKPFDERKEKIQESGYHKYEWVCGPELASMMYDYYSYTQNKTFAQDTLVPFSHQVILFFKEHYPKNSNGQLVFEPAQALETWWKCTDAMPEVAGIHYLVKKLKQLPADVVSPELTALLNEMEKIMPPIPLHEVDGKTMLAPARKFEAHKNVENPELYSIFPFKLFGVGKPAIDQAINAYHYRNPKGNFGWRQDDLFAALLGLTDEAKTGIIERAKKWDKEHQFPAFWGPNYDWTPDQDHGGVLMKTLQMMVLQCDDNEIRLLPSWPKEWDVNFKLRAPRNTTVECIYRNGKIEKLTVWPESRKKDIVMPLF